MKNAFNSEILHSFSMINQQLFRHAKADAEKSGMTVPQLKALYKISSKPGMGLVELAEELKLTNSTVSALVERLVQHGYLERNRPSQDRRAITITLSEAGEAKLGEIVANDSILVKKLQEIQELPREEIEKLLELHEKITAILSQDVD